MFVVIRSEKFVLMLLEAVFAVEGRNASVNCEKNSQAPYINHVKVKVNLTTNTKRPSRDSTGVAGGVKSVNIINGWRRVCEENYDVKTSLENTFPNRKLRRGCC